MENNANINEFMEYCKSTLSALLQPLLLLALFFSAPSIIAYGLDNSIGLFLPILIGFLSWFLWLCGLCLSALAPFVFTYMIVQYYLGEPIEIKEFLLKFDKAWIWPILLVVSYQHLVALSPLILVTFMMPFTMVFPPLLFLVFLLFIPAGFITTVFGFVLAYSSQLFFFHRAVNLEPLILSFNLVKKNILSIILFSLCMWMLNSVVSMAFGSASFFSMLFSMAMNYDVSSFDMSSLESLSQSEIQNKLMAFSQYFKANLIDQVRGVFHVFMNQSLNAIFFLYIVGFLKAPHEFKLKLSTKLK